MLEVNTIYNMDCIEGMKLLDSESIDLILTDPPYKTTARGNAGNAGGMLQKNINKKGMVFEHNNIEMGDYIPELYRLLKEGSHIYIMTNHTNLHEMLNELKKAGFHFIKSLIWDKGNKIMGTAYMSQFEYILFCRKGAFKKINYCGTSDILSFPNKKTKRNGVNLHDTEKPVDLMKVLIENSTNVDDLVLDPFMGIGATALASVMAGRNFIGFEIDETYFKLANGRIADSKAQVRFDIG